MNILNCVVFDKKCKNDATFHQSPFSKHDFKMMRQNFKLFKLHLQLFLHSTYFLDFHSKAENSTLKHSDTFTLIRTTSNFINNIYVIQNNLHAIFELGIDLPQ